VTWLPHEISFQLDNQIVGIVTRRIPDTPMHLVIQIETETNAPAPSDAAAGYVQIGWLAVYTPACNPFMSVVRSAAACTG
jgi:beta-glucanase (GH16 family)